MEVLGGTHLAGELIWRDGDVWHRAWQGSGKAGLSSTADLTTPPHGCLRAADLTESSGLQEQASP